MFGRLFVVDYVQDADGGGGEQVFDDFAVAVLGGPVQRRPTLGVDRQQREAGRVQLLDPLQIAVLGRFDDAGARLFQQRANGSSSSSSSNGKKKERKKENESINRVDNGRLG